MEMMVLVTGILLGKLATPGKVLEVGVLPKT